MDKNHRKPTQAELDAGIAADLAALDATDTTTTDTTDDDVDTTDTADTSTDTTADTTTTDDDTDDDSTDTDDTTATDTADTTTTDDDTDDDEAKKRYAESSREAKKLAADQRIMNEAFRNASNAETPTEDEIKTKYPDWDLMSETEKKLAAESTLNSKRFELLSKGHEETEVVQEWNKKAEVYIDDPKSLIAHPELEGKRDRFLEFSADPTNRNINFDTLVSAFLYKVSQDRSVRKEKNKGAMMESGTSGDKKITPSNTKITLAQAEVLKNTNYREYLKHVKADNIQDPV